MIQKVKEERNWKSRLGSWWESESSRSVSLVWVRVVCWKKIYFSLYIYFWKERILKLKYSEKVGLGQGKCVLFMFRFGTVDIFKKRNMFSNYIAQKKYIKYTCFNMDDILIPKLPKTIIVCVYNTYTCAFIYTYVCIAIWVLYIYIYIWTHRVVCYWNKSAP